MAADATIDKENKVQIQDRILIPIMAFVFTVTVQAVLVEGQVLDRPLTDSDRFALFTECAPVKLQVLGSYDLADMAEIRLRSARLYSEGISRPTTDRAVLQLNNMAMASGRLAESLLFRKLFTDPLSGVTWQAYTWLRFCCDFSEMIDEFVIMYLRVNEEYC